MGITIEEMRAYILIRNSNLPADDRKRIVVKSKGNLVYKDVLSTLKLLGSKFFNEVQGTSKAMGKKTYDINFVDDDPIESMPDINETVFYAQDINEEQALEWLASEGDEDALVMSQFEDLIIDCIQNDSEAAACLNAYTEARQKLILKAKSRGFWGKGGKDRSKGKSKGFKGSNFQQNRRPSLAQRIAESTCRICNQKGHWKWECPNKDRFKQGSGVSSQPSNPQAFAGVTSVESVKETDEWDVLNVSEPPPEATAFVIQECHHSCVHDASGRFNHIGDKSYKAWGSGVDNILRKVIRRAFHQPPMHHDPSRKKMTECGRPEYPGSSKPLSSVDSAKTDHRSVEDAQAFFATQGSFGIVDLGASLSVIGKDQFKDLCKNLPSNVIRSMKETACAVNFRFGNDSVVQGRKAVFIPLGKHWLKIIVVPSNTPFLIANNVFRQFGAQIDTANDSIWFRRLECTVPIVLSERKLYMLDVADLISRVNAKDAEVVNTATTCPQILKSLVTPEEPNKRNTIKDQVITVDFQRDTHDRNHGMVESIEHNNLKHCPPKSIASVDVDPLVASRSSPCHANDSEESTEASQRLGCSIQAGDQLQSNGRRGERVREDSTNDTGRVEQGVHLLRHNLCGKAVPLPDGGNKVRHVVRELYQHSHRPSHAKFIRYIQLYVEDLENNPLQAKAKSCPKAKGKSQPKGYYAEQSVAAQAHPTLSSEEEEEFDPMDPLPAGSWEQVEPVPNLEMQELRERMHKMEDVMQQVLHHLSQQTNQSAK